MAIVLIGVMFALPAYAERGITLQWKDRMLTVSRDDLPGGPVEIHYLEAYCRAGSTDADWVKHTVIKHDSELVEASDDGRRIELRDTLADGVIVDHVITAGRDEVTFEVTARNPTDKVSEAHWAQPCMRVGRFTGTGPDDTPDKYAYVKKCFIFLDGKLTRMPTPDWATEARYTPGQVWAGPGVPRSDVNPRPLNPHVPSNGLIGCFSKGEKMILAMAWQPYQELFQGVIRCIHNDFRLGGLQPGQTRQIRGKLYLVPNDVEALLARYRSDFESKP